MWGKMQTYIFISGGLGALLLSIGAFLFFFNKTASLWIFFAGVVFSLLALTLHLQDNIFRENDDLSHNASNKEFAGYVGVTAVRVMISPERRVTAEVQYTNNTDIPAYNFNHVALLIVSREPTEEDSANVMNTLDPENHKGMTMLPRMFFTGSYFAESPVYVSERDTTYTLMGAFSYRDPNKKLHKVLFCYVCIPNTTIFHPYKKFNTDF